jgi:hypothetical protein
LYVAQTKSVLSEIDGDPPEQGFRFGCGLQCPGKHLDSFTFSPSNFHWEEDVYIDPAVEIV